MPLYILLSAFSCSTPPLEAPVTKVELLRQDQKEMGGEISTWARPFQVRSSKSVIEYCQKIANEMTAEVEGLKNLDLKVELIKNEDRKITSYGVPGVTLYLSVDFLKLVRYENELAALIAMQIAHIKSRHLIKNLDKIRPYDLPALKKTGWARIFNYSATQMQEAVSESVALIYRRGFDPRGLFNFWNHHEESKTLSQFSLSQITDLKRQTRNAIVRYAPLLNPIIKRDEFQVILKRIREL